MANPPRISILVTVFNREAYLPECLSSILASTFTDFEVIILDDCSSDHSIKIAKEFTKQDPRFLLSTNESNLGDYPNRSKAIELSSGRLLKFVDADDFLYPDSLKLMVNAMAKNPDAALALSQSSPELDQPYPFPISPEEAYRRQFLGRGCLNCGPSGAIFRRDAYQELGGFRNWGVLNDTDLWLRMAARWPVVLLPPALVWWRRHEGQEFERGMANGDYLKDGFSLGLETLESDHCPLPSGEKAAAISRLRQHHARRILALATKGRKPGEAFRLAGKSGLSVSEILGGLRRYI